MRLTTIIISLIALAAIGLAGCDKAVEPNLDPNSGSDAMPDLAQLQAAAWPAHYQAPPTPLVTVDIGYDAVEFWPYTASNFSGEPKDPINLLFFGQADPRDIRTALLSLDGDRTALGMPPMPPFNSEWVDNADGDIQASYGSSCGWTPGAIQLVCGDYDIRFHLRLFKVGHWTLGGVHFEVQIPGTADHQVLSWEVAEQFVAADFMRSGLLDGDVPVIPTDAINDSPFRTIPAIIYNELPVELRGLIGGPLEDVAADVPIGTDGHALVLNLAGTADLVPGYWTFEKVLNYGQLVPKPFCDSGPDDYVYVEGPLTMVETIEVTEWNTYQASFKAEGVLTVTPMNPITYEPIGEPFTANVKQLQNSVFSQGVQSAASLRFQSLHPFNTPGSGWLFERFRVSSKGGNGHQLIVRCETEQAPTQELVSQAESIDTGGQCEVGRLVNME